QPPRPAAAPAPTALPPVPAWYPGCCVVPQAPGPPCAPTRCPAGGPAGHALSPLPAVPPPRTGPHPFARARTPRTHPRLDPHPPDICAPPKAAAASAPVPPPPGGASSICTRRMATVVLAVSARTAGLESSLR